MAFPVQLANVKKQLEEGLVVEETIRVLLSWFGAERRTWRNIKRIRAALKEAGLMTLPDFEGEFIDSEVSFFNAIEYNNRVEAFRKEQSRRAVDQTVPVPVESDAQASDAELADPAHRINRLPSANKPPRRVAPDATVEQAITIMLQYDFSQLPVMTSEREVKGIFSWKSLGGRLVLGQPCKTVRECMDHHQEIGAEASLFDAVRTIAEHDCVLVRDSTKVICGIVTAYDISVQFQQLAEPFLIIGDIENHIRFLIDSRFDAADLQAMKDPADTGRKIADASDLTFGEYVRLFQNETMWNKLEAQIDRKLFTEELDRIREIRNDIMHFDPDPIEASAMIALKQFGAFLSRLMEITNAK